MWQVGIAARRAWRVAAYWTCTARISLTEIWGICNVTVKATHVLHRDDIWGNQVRLHDGGTVLNTAEEKCVFVNTTGTIQLHAQAGEIWRKMGRCTGVSRESAECYAPTHGQFCFNTDSVRFSTSNINWTGLRANGRIVLSWKLENRIWGCAMH